MITGDEVGCYAGKRKYISWYWFLLLEKQGNTNYKKSGIECLFKTHLKLWKKDKPEVKRRGSP